MVRVDVVKKIGQRRDRQIRHENRPLHAGTSFVVMYIDYYKSVDVNILGCVS